MGNSELLNSINNSAVYTEQIKKKYDSTIRRALGIPALLTFDLLAIMFCLMAAIYIRDSIFRQLFPGLYSHELLDVTLTKIWWFPLIVVLCLIYENLYQKRISFWIETEIIIKAVTLSVFLTIVWLYLSQIDDQISRTLIVLTWLLLIFILPLSRYAGKLLLGKLNLWTRPVIIVGNGEAAEMIALAFQREKTLGYKIIGAIADYPNLVASAKIHPKQDFPLLGSVKDAARIFKASGVRDVVIVLSGMPTKKQVNISNHFQQLACTVLLVPDLLGLSLNGLELQYFFKEQIMLLQIKNRLKSGFNRMVKALADLTLGTFLVLLGIPLFLLLILAIKVESRGPVLYPCKRIGQNGKIFTCYKFRTMHLNAEDLLNQHLNNNPRVKREWLKYRKLTGHDPRVTRVGHFLRRFSLDELPQLINVLRREMSLVGPRPYMLSEKEHIKEYFNEIIIAKPGMTGLWQISGRNRISFSGRMKLDSWYMKNWSPWLDLMILFRTIKVVITADGAH